jgi:hypothetical protein
MAARSPSKKAEDRLIEALMVCHSNSDLMEGKGRWATNFWVAVRSQVSWLRGIDIRLLEEFFLILAEAARCGMDVEIPSTVAFWARLFARHIQQVEARVGKPTGVWLNAFRGMERHEKTNRPYGSPQKLFPIWAF